MSTPTAPSRPKIGLVALALIAAIVSLDLLRADPVDPFSVPPPSALGSGQAPSGAHCSAG